ncbi:MAG: hypothetical protein QUS08_08550 [Methanothrix sp.]|nr:hypothetical protein [Methanothrix sp.]
MGLTRTDKRRRIGRGSRTEEMAAMELAAAKEILAEVFSISLQEVEEMIRRRSEERALWPERFCIDD